MDSKLFEQIVREMVTEYTNSEKEGWMIKEEDVYIVWSCKTLQNNKALASTPVNDGMYYEITYNGDKKEVYFDAYNKEFNFSMYLGEE